MPAQSATTAYDFSADSLDGRTVSLDEFRGRVLLIVNTASHCGFTPQYAGLEKLYRTYKEQGLEILAFPCNQFGAQEPGSAQEIGTFCERNFGVTFPVFAKVEVNGKNAHPLFAFLRREKPGLLGLVGADGIKWNFTKFLIDRRGRVVERFSPSTSPETLAGRIEDLLGGPV